ncbi:DUF3189 family protein [Pelotomaculum terephthalicicum JT]|uniref:DUF3189 family protein n=1 Tax=Pelotomaculum TaxID=191373 RepID=UPI0009CD46EC|nr:MULTISPECIES: DUF3189 family protein [Pelotomaculum]MCG9967708.1 DUF3189 family protein [Pelotomaculum terephthalicicum JT]OPX83998.1 MAG: hypothetical protein A4E54_02963 [Pelotomaculum sp. PtaB.Bin117]OPY62937.1 MAG: hypothetical protein A4E56_01004 [Pelotomaculum sp. PtaU1.Bin065]
MKIIYHCYGGAHSSVTAASIHLGMLPADRVPGLKAFWEIPFYDRQEKDEHGHIFFMGLDEAGNEIYFSACRGRPLVFQNIFKGLAGIFEIPAEEYLLVDVMKNVNWTMKLGGYLSRRCGFIRVGRPIVTLGTQAAYLQVINLVRQVKKAIRCCGEENSIRQRQ